MSMMVSFVLSFFPRDVLDEILNLIESVSEDFPSYFYIQSLFTKESQRSSAVSVYMFGIHTESKARIKIQYSPTFSKQRYNKINCIFLMKLNHKELLQMSINTRTCHLTQ